VEPPHPDRVDLLDLLDRGAVSDAVTRLTGDTLVERVLRAWELTRHGEPAAAQAVLRPIIADLEKRSRDGASQRVHAHAVLALGVACVLDGDAEGGTALVERALTLHTAPWPRALALRYGALALEQRGAWEGAAGRYLASAEVYREIGNDFGTGSALYGAAVCLADGGARDRACALLLDAEQVLRRSDTATLGAALAQLATLTAERDPARALALIEEAESLTRDCPKMYLWDIRLRRGEVLLQLGRAEDALPPIEGARALISASMPDAVWSDHLLIRALLDVGRVADAARTLEESERSGRGPARGLPGAARVERAALRLLIAARGGAPIEDADAALDELERGSRVGWYRHGVGALVEQSARLLLAAARVDASATASDRAVRAWQRASALGTRVDADGLGALRAAGARIPLGPLWLQARIGRSGMADVWLATHRGGTQVAVKLLRGEHVRAHGALFDAELQAVARLDHPRVVRVLAALRIDPVAAAMLSVDGEAVAEGGDTLVLELAQGGSLEARMSPRPWVETRTLLLELLAALGHAHARGVLHLDLKPANILLDVDGRGASLRLTDFGLAGLARSRSDQRVFGTPAYMAPEQAIGGASLGPQTDLYALGCLAWRLLTGAVPFPAESLSDTLGLHRSAPLPPFLPQRPAPAGTEGWLRCLLAKRPENRFATAADAAWALTRLGDVADDAPLTPQERAEGAGETFEPAALASWGSGWSGGGTLTTHLAVTVPVPLAGPGGSGGAGESAAPGAAPPFLSNWRVAAGHDAVPFLPGAGEGLFTWRVGRLVGREAERDRLWAHLGAVHGDRAGRAVWVQGADGLGRSALLGWLGEMARVTGAAWVTTDLDAPVPAEDRPRLVLLDDPEPAEAERLIARAAERAALVVVASRAAAPAGTEPLTLAPLSDAEIRALLDLRLPIDNALATKLSARAGGSPAFAVALLTDLVRRGVLEPGPEGFREAPGAELALPEDLRSLWTARLDALAPAGSPRRSAWEIAAIIGACVPLALFADACDGAGLSPDAQVFAPMEAEGWVHVGPDGALRFRVPAVREALVDGAVRGARAWMWHAIVAEVLPTEERSRGLHLAGAGRHADALKPLRRAAADAVNATRLQECRELLAQWDRSADAIGLSPDDPQRASPIVVRVHLALHTRDDPYPLLERGLALAEGESAAQLAYTHGGVLAQDGRHADAESAYVRAIALCEQLGLAELRDIASFGLAGSRFALGRDATAILAGLRAGSPREEFGVRLNACEGRGAVLLGRFAFAEPLLGAAVEGARRIGAPDVEADALTDLAEVRLALHGDHPGALALLERAVQVLVDAGSDKALRARLRLAAALLLAGRHDDARAVLVPARRFGWRLGRHGEAELALLEACLRGDRAAARAALPAGAALLWRRLVAEVSDETAGSTPV
jgi:tetratricopeptide (TPR) repeat protein